MLHMSNLSSKILGKLSFILTLPSPGSIIIVFIPLICWEFKFNSKLNLKLKQQFNIVKTKDMLEVINKFHIWHQLMQVFLLYCLWGINSSSNQSISKDYIRFSKKLKREEGF